MFENYVGAKQRKRPKWVGLVVAISVAVHVIGGSALVIRSFWVIDKLTPPEARPILSLGPPPPPPPPKGKKKSSSLKEKVQKRQKVSDTVQPEEKPEEIDPEEIASADEGEGEDFGVEGGVEGGVAGGVVGGVLGGVPGGTLGGTGVAPPPPPEPEKPQVVPQVALKQYFIAGEREPQPPESVKNLMVKQGETKTVTTVKMCLSKGGSVKSLRVLKSSGYQEYDSLIQRKMKQWKYRPFKVNNKAVPVCTSVTFIYRQS